VSRTFVQLEAQREVTTRAASYKKQLEELGEDGPDLRLIFAITNTFMSSSIPARPMPPRAAAHDYAGGEDVAHGARSARSGKRDNRAREAPGSWSMVVERTSHSRGLHEGDATGASLLFQRLYKRLGNLRVPEAAIGLFA
jgi:hypothetical protein